MSNITELIDVNLFKIYIHSNEEYISNHIKKYKAFEPYIGEVLIEIFKKYKNQQYTFIDIGANIGYFSLLAAYFGLNVISFEPIHKNYSLFYNSILQNNLDHKITVYKNALYNHNTELEFVTSDYNMGLCCLKDKSSHITNISNIEKIDAKTFDYYFEKNDQKLFYIVKIDVELTESEVLEGMKNSIPYIDCIIIEIGEDNKNCIKQLKQYGFIHAVNIGHTGDRKTELQMDTCYLDNNKYYYDIDNVDSLFKSTKQINIAVFKKL